jgi:hypothetical protein
MDRNTLAKSYNENNLPKRVDKTIAWLINSRDGWKDKCIETKLNLKRQTQGTKRVKNSRDEYKLKNIRLKLELAESKELNLMLQDRIRELDSQIQSKSNELYELKKKQ